MQAVAKNTISGCKLLLSLLSFGTKNAKGRDAIQCISGLLCLGLSGFLVAVGDCARQSCRCFDYHNITISLEGQFGQSLANWRELLGFGFLKRARLIDLIQGLEYCGAKFLS